VLNLDQKRNAAGSALSHASPSAASRPSPAKRSWQNESSKRHKVVTTTRRDATASTPPEMEPDTHPSWALQRNDANKDGWCIAPEPGTAQAPTASKITRPAPEKAAVAPAVGSTPSAASTASVPGAAPARAARAAQSSPDPQIAQSTTSMTDRKLFDYDMGTAVGVGDGDLGGGDCDCGVADIERELGVEERRALTSRKH